MRESYLFDIDGTLVDLTEAHVASYQSGYKTIFGINAPKKTLVSKFGMAEFPMHESICKELNIEYTPEQINNIIEIWQSKTIEFLDISGSTPLKGVIDCLNELKRNEKLIGIITGNSRRMGEKILDLSKIKDYFSIFSYGDNAENRIQIVTEAIRQIKNKGHNNPDVIIVGDSPSDIHAGKAVNALTVGVATGHYSVEELKTLNPNLTLKDLTEYQKIFQL